MLERDAQLRQPSVREFIKTMEQQRLSPKKTWASITSLMRDGRALALKLNAAGREESDDKKLKKLRACVSPYVQVVEPGIACEFTGLKLTDIWRYFSHTWVSNYKSLPGRSMLLLIRDAAAPNHPVMGIAALGSSMAQQTQRDRWIGWDSETFADRITEKPTARVCRWVHESIERLLGSIYIKDLLNDGILERRDLKMTTKKVIDRGLTVCSAKIFARQSSMAVFPLLRITKAALTGTVLEKWIGKDKRTRRCFDPNAQRRSHYYSASVKGSVPQIRMFRPLGIAAT